MIRQSKPTQHAIAAMSRLAEVYADPAAWLSSADIARSRSLRKPVVAKILSLLAQNRLVEGSPGPGGGYRLGRSPGEISLWDIACLFERPSETGCPYGPGWCGQGSPCPLHDSLMALQRVAEDFMRNTRLDVFARSPRPAVGAAAPDTRADAAGGSRRPARRSR